MIAPQRSRSSIVSNSGTMLTRERARRAASPTSFSSTRDLEQVGHRLALRDHVVRQRRGAVAALDVGGDAQDRELGARRAPNSRDAANAAGAGCASSRSEQRDARRLAQRRVVGRDAARARAARRPPPRARRCSAAGRAPRGGSRTRRRRAAADRAAAPRAASRRASRATRAIVSRSARELAGVRIRRARRRAARAAGRSSASARAVAASRA